MKKALQKIINSLGYKIQKTSKDKNSKLQFLQRFHIEKNIDILFKAKSYIENLSKYFDDVQIENHRDGFIVSFSGVKIYVESAEEFFIINEVFIENDYNFKSLSSAVVIDIGANIGISSLFFSQLSNVEKIYAFEPVEDTFAQAQYNFTLNSNLSKVHSLQNFGLGKNDRDEVFMFNKFIKGNTGVRGKLSSSYANSTHVVEKNVKIRDASKVFSEILDENARKQIIVKMDCEGAEYEIFESLQKSQLISQIDVFMIEWHDHGAEAIESKLIDAGFSFFSRRLAINSGMLYAIKNRVL
jgi:FkbM family methyltransferase